MGMEAYRARDWARALEVLDTAVALCPRDAPSRIYRDRCAQFAENRPPDDWDGVFVMKDK